MKIVVVSDSHRNYSSLQLVKSANSDADLFIHCGDFQTSQDQLQGFLAVAGNNDIWSGVPEQRVLTCADVKIWIIHSDQYSGSYRIEYLFKKAQENQYQLVCFGHTHTPYIEKRDGIWLVNPGSLWYNRDGSAIGYVVVNIAEGEIVNIQRVAL